MDRTVDYLLNTYDCEDNKTEKLAKGELWAIDHAIKNREDRRTFDRLNKLETIVNERITKSRGTFQLPKQQKDRARYLIQHLDFYLGRTSEEQYIVMILIYVKLERNNKRTINDYQSLLDEYGIPISTFVRFLIKLNVYHLEN